VSLFLVFNIIRLVAECFYKSFLKTLSHDLHVFVSIEILSRA
jgi:hypothetical protein